MLARVTPVSPSQLVARRALAVGEPLRALGLIGRDDSAPALMLRGIAYAQLGDLDLARVSLSRAAALADEPLTRARARAALVEIALNAGDPGPAARDATACAEELDELGDGRNAAMQRLVLARAEVLLGRLGEARHVVEQVMTADSPADLFAVACLAQAEIAVRGLAATAARDALARARRSLEGAPHPLLERALAALEGELSVPVARILRSGALKDADLFAIEDASRGQVLLVDACRQLAIGGRVTIPLARRPVLFALLLALGRAWPGSVARDELAARAFDARKVNASHRSRLRVEMGRLRRIMDGLAAEPKASDDGYVLSSAAGRRRAAPSFGRRGRTYRVSARRWRLVVGAGSRRARRRLEEDGAARARGARGERRRGAHGQGQATCAMRDREAPSRHECYSSDSCPRGRGSEEAP